MYDWDVSGGSLIVRKHPTVEEALQPPVPHHAVGLRVLNVLGTAHRPSCSTIGFCGSKNSPDSAVEPFVESPPLSSQLDSSRVSRPLRSAQNEAERRG